MINQSELQKELDSIINIEDYVNSLSQSELLIKISQYTSLCKSRLSEYSKLLSSEDVPSNPIKKDSTQTTKRIDIDATLDNISDNEDYENESLMRIKYESRISNMENEYKNKLEQTKEKITNEYEKQKEKMSNEFEEKMNNLQKEIDDIQSELTEYEDTNKYIKKKDHENRIQQILDDNSNEFKELQSKVEEQENIIKDKYHHLISENESIQYIIPKFDKKVANDYDFDNKVNSCITQLKSQNGNNNYITLVTPFFDFDNLFSYKQSILQTDYDFKDMESDCLDTENDVVVNPIKHSDYIIMKDRNNKCKNHLFSY